MLLTINNVLQTFRTFSEVVNSMLIVKLALRFLIMIQLKLDKLKSIMKWLGNIDHNVRMRYCT